MGFEPTTFCMASVSVGCGALRLFVFPLLIAGFGDSGQLGVCGWFLTLC
jgi:hypothetical protein